jgi:hypothetical protein
MEYESPNDSLESRIILLIKYVSKTDVNELIQDPCRHHSRFGTFAVRSYCKSEKIQSKSEDYRRQLRAEGVSSHSTPLGSTDTAVAPQVTK